MLIDKNFNKPRDHTLISFTDLAISAAISVCFSTSSSTNAF
ncbi:hypothetical protein ACHAXS_010273 [Conticribra weissflogii]